MPKGGENNFTFGEFANEAKPELITIEDSVDDTVQEEIKEDLTIKKDSSDKKDDSEYILIPDKDEVVNDVLDESDKDIPGDTSSDSSPSLKYKAWAKALSDEGVFPNFTDEEFDQYEQESGSPYGALLKLQELQKDEQEKEFIARLNPSDKDTYNASKEGVDVQDYKRVKNEQSLLESLTAKNLEDENTQEQLGKYYFALTGIDNDRAADIIENYKDLGKLEGFAKEILPKVKDMLVKEEEGLLAKAQATKKAQEVEKTNSLIETKNFINGLQDVIPGVNINKNIKDKVYNSMTTAVARDEYGNNIDVVTETRNKNPKSFNTLIHLYHSMGLFNVDKNGLPNPDWSKIINSVRTKSNKKFDDLLTRSNTDFNSNSSSSKSKISGAFGDEFLK